MSNVTAVVAPSASSLVSQITGIHSFDDLKVFEARVMEMDVHPTTKNHLLREASRLYFDSHPLH
ncbi:hypothetical protein ACEUCJ_15340 [Aeromonas rivipollensis]|jgi:hypothetical protein|uniref:hypothetical protein n=1 Tax=Aeromonas rivipollensis TaxID=948519 RepID=UPI0038CF79AE